MKFKDHFSNVSEEYARSRPIYPESLYEFLAEKSPSKNLAWDCATGNGQAAIGLCEYFKSVIATDASSEQIKYSKERSNIQYRVAPAEESGLESNSVDLVTAAAAVHWFELEKFYTEIRRVCRPNAMIAFWIYDDEIKIDDSIDLVMEEFLQVVKPYFPEEVQKSWSLGFEKMHFPFQEIESPEFASEIHWSCESLLGFIYSWSGVRRHIEQNGDLAWKEFSTRLNAAWPSSDPTLTHNWKLKTRFGILPTR